MHTVVYLDHNYVSNMAKVKAKLIKDENQAEFWKALFEELKKAVLADKVACPESEFHSTEAMYYRKLEEPIGQVIEELSWGLRFRPWEDILWSQIEDAAKYFLGKQIDEREPWAIAFESDPQAPVESRMHDILGAKGRISVRFSIPDEIVELDSQRKQRFVGKVQELLSTHTSSCPADLSKAIIQEKRSFISGSIGSQAIMSAIQQSQAESLLSQFAAHINLRNLEKRWMKLNEIGINASNARVFLQSNELLNAPFVDIFATIYAVIDTYYPARKPQQGDFYDMAIMATALPFCDIVTTDKFLKEVLSNILRFDDKYKARVFSASEADRQTFLQLVGKLPNKN